MRGLIQLVRFDLDHSYWIRPCSKWFRLRTNTRSYLKWGLIQLVRGFICRLVKTCKHDTKWTVSAWTVKLGTHTPYDKRMTPIDFQGQGSKIKVTCYKLLLNLVNMIQTEPFQLGPSNLLHIQCTSYDKRKTPIDFQGQGQRSRSYATHCC